MSMLQFHVQYAALNLQHDFLSTQEQRLMSHLLTLLAPNKRLPPPSNHQTQHRTVEADGDKPLIEVVDDL